MGNNQKRGCGHKRDGLVYGEADTGPGGELNRFTWALDSGHLGGALLWLDLPALGQVAFNPRLSLYFNRFVSFDQGAAIEAEQGRELSAQIPPQIWNLGSFALADHVGKNNYPTPWSFVGEVMRLGPSRVIRQDLARLAAEYTPFPIFFTHDVVPLFDDKEQAERFIVEELEDEPGKLRMLPCWEYLDWGLSVYHWDGWAEGADVEGKDHVKLPSHYMARIIRHWDKMEKPLSGGSLRHDTLIGASWITKVSYYTNDGRAAPKSLKAAGIRSVKIDPAE